ncbi:GNAT family N-acetyltransferase [Deinococcus sp. Arct2-2]|uniref:GNAT family N-acetyltransferase n=1 Tax=Deinococcus sp. Arct2-2 TaxID=2568653 RepID=UPI0010A5292C|nr:GNAT family N-acetyltransferase [Deinococcus sp. Arct2-2]THF66780.1 GNAT family N-acetyltransferase [Deinococcus sp. Arct2-2]
MSRWRVRPVEDADWDAAAEVWTAAHPHDPFSGPELKHQTQQQATWGYRHTALVAEAEGGATLGNTVLGSAVVGLGLLSQNPGMYHPQRFELEVAVRPEWQGQGVGAALWRELEGLLRGWNALSVRTLAREDHPLAPHFLTRRGFSPGKRYFTSALNLNQAFDETPFSPTETRLAALDVRVLSLAELREAGTPDLPRRLHALMSDVRQDVPRSEPATPLTFEVFNEAILNDSCLLPDAYLIAQAPNGDWLGQSTLFRSEASADLLTGLTGVTRDWRGQGVATLLKLHILRVAQALAVQRGGDVFLRTDNASDNAPMLAINDRFGFVRDPASVSWVLDLGANDQS